MSDEKETQEKVESIPLWRELTELAFDLNQLDEDHCSVRAYNDYDTIDAIEAAMKKNPTWEQFQYIVQNEFL